MTADLSDDADTRLQNSNSSPKSRQEITKRCDWQLSLPNNYGLTNNIQLRSTTDHLITDHLITDSLFAERRSIALHNTILQITVYRAYSAVQLFTTGS